MRGAEQYSPPVTDICKDACTCFRAQLCWQPGGMDVPGNLTHAVYLVEIAPHRDAVHGARTPVNQRGNAHEPGYLPLHFSLDPDVQTPEHEQDGKRRAVKAGDHEMPARRERGQLHIRNAPIASTTAAMMSAVALPFRTFFASVWRRPVRHRTSPFTRMLQ